MKLSTWYFRVREAHTFVPVLRKFSISEDAWRTAALLLALLAVRNARAQVSVLTAHNDVARTGQNLNETILTPTNVNANQFGKLFSQTVDGWMLAQPLYVSNLAIPGKGTHNVVFVATGGLGGQGDSVYAFDADSNGGANGSPLWHVSLLTNSTPAGTLSITGAAGVWGTPVIDPSSNTMYLVSNEMKGSAETFRFHALDITTGAEKFGGPLTVQASVPGNGSASTGGVLAFDPTYAKQRPGLLLQNGIVYAAFGSDNDEGVWHGWLFSFGVNAGSQTLRQINAFCTTPNASGGGIWMGGSGVVGEVYNPAKPYGRLFLSVGNGSFSNQSPVSYGMSVLDLDLTGGVMTVEDVFTPFNEALYDNQDGDLGSGGPLLLPTQTLASGKILKPLLETGKSGMMYILDRDNNADGSNNATTEYSPAGLGGFNSNADQVVQEVQTPLTPGYDWGAGVWGTEAYWNNSIYSGGTNVDNPGNTGGKGTSLAVYSFVNGKLSTTPTSQSKDLFFFPGPTPSISANGNSNGLVWALSAYPQSNGSTVLILLAYNATNLGTTLYSSNTNLARDNPGYAEKFTVPTIANGKVYVGASDVLDVYGLLNEPTAPAPFFNPGTETFTSPPFVSMTDSVAGATIYYTTDGSMPTTNSTVYQAGNPPYVSGNETINAIASANGYLQSSVTTAVYVSAALPNNPVFSLAAGAYTGTQTLSITDSTAGAVIYYTLNGSTPTTASAVYTQPLQISSSETVEAIAVTGGKNASAVVSASYTLQPAGTINFTQGFTLAQGPMTFNGSTDLDDFRLQLTNGGQNEHGSAFYATPVNIQTFTTSFTFQLSNPVADGMTFTIQNDGPTALGGSGGGLGFQNLAKSVAIKFDIFSNAGEGPDSTGLYVDGAAPTLPAVNLTGTGIDLHSQDYINANLVYNGTTLTVTLTDAVTLATWSDSFVINIPATVGGNTAYVGFTAGTGGGSSSQKVTSWLFEPGTSGSTAPAGLLTPANFTLNGGAAFAGTELQLTDGNPNETRTAFLTNPVNVQQFTASFEFQLTNATGDGFTFTVQGDGPTVVHGAGGGLGYQNTPKSVAVKFDLYSNSGEGPDSTGLYTNGTSPTVPAIDLSSTGINFHSGDAFNVQLTYNGTQLTEVITDLVTEATVTENYTVNIPTIVGGPNAYVGFTAASGGATAVQDILNFNYSSQ